MGYRSLRECIRDLDRHGHLVRIDEVVDGYLEVAEIHRQIFDRQGPAIFFSRIKGSPFPAVSNLYGTKERIQFLFRDSLEQVKRVTHLKHNPQLALRNFTTYAPALWTATKAIPKKVRSGPVMKNLGSLDILPKITSWPEDGGAFITLPQVCTLPPDSTAIMDTNLGMYRIQLDGNDYKDNEIGLHYQLHRGIGVHHKAYLQSEKEFKVSIFVGGPPSHAFSAIMPMPEGLSEFTFAGMLNQRRFRYLIKDGYVISTDADFVITGVVDKKQLKREGPFGDHLGYYSLAHLFPFMRVDQVYYRSDAIWHFTVVGRPPAEDSGFGYLIHELVSDLSREEFPGIHSVHAVDESGVHPLLLAVGSERYMPFREERPEEILCQANHLLGKGQTSLAKYLWIANHYDNPNLEASDVPSFFRHMLERVEWSRDLHFYTRTTIDTLDYSGTNWNEGSKVVIAACAKEPVRKLDSLLPSSLPTNDLIHNYEVISEGILALSTTPFIDHATANDEAQQIEELLKATISVDRFPLLIWCDDAKYIASDYANFLWITFTRSNPATDIYGFSSFIQEKHWGCHGSLLIDARKKPHHAPELEIDQHTVHQAKKKVSTALT